MDQLVSLFSKLNSVEEGLVQAKYFYYKLSKLDAKPNDLALNKLFQVWVGFGKDWTRECCKTLRRFEARSEKLIEFGNISFSAKSI